MSPAASLQFFLFQNCVVQNCDCRRQHRYSKEDTSYHNNDRPAYCSAYEKSMTHHNTYTVVSTHKPYIPGKVYSLSCSEIISPVFSYQSLSAPLRSTEIGRASCRERV